MHEQLPKHLERYPTSSGREALAARLRLTYEPSAQDWEWQVADHTQFAEWLAVFRAEQLSDDEQFSLMEMLIQCVEDMARRVCESPVDVQNLPQWQAIAGLLRANPALHASSIVYWSMLDSDNAEKLDDGDSEMQFCVSAAMRRIWDDVRSSLTQP